MFTAWETTGQWWLPTTPGDISTGTLVFNPDSGAKLLNVLGPLAEAHPNPGQGPQLLQGRTTDGNFITLASLYCFQTRFFPPSAGFEVDLLLKGHHFATLEEISFSRFECQYSNLRSWVGDRGTIAVQHEPREQGPPIRDRHTVSVEYPNLWDVMFNDIRIRYFNRSTTSNDLRTGSVVFATEEGLRIDFPSEVPLAEFHRLERSVRQFIDLLCNAQIQRAKLTGGPLSNVEIIHRSRMGRNERKDPVQLHIPVEFGQIESEINDILGRWLTMYSTLEPMLSLFFLGLHDRDINIENVFLGIMQALEAFHRSFFPDTFVPPEDYETSILPALLAAIPQTIDPGFRQSLTTKMRYGNERSLRARLRDLIQSLPGGVTFDDYREASLIGRSVDTRNNFTHVITDASSVYSAVELYRAVQLWQEVMFALILMRLELQDAAIDSALQAIQSSRGTFLES